MLLTPTGSRLVWWPIQSNLVNSVFFQRWSWGKSDTQPIPWIAPGRLAVNQTIGLPPRARDDFVHILDIFDIFGHFVHIVDIFGHRARRLGNLGAGGCDKRTNVATIWRIGEEGGKGTTQPLQQILIVNKSRWQSTNTGSVTIHKYRIYDKSLHQLRTAMHHHP